MGTSQRSKLEPAYGKTCGKDFTCLVKTGLEVYSGRMGVGGGLLHTEKLFGPRLVLPQAGLRPSNFHLGSAVHRQF